MRVHKSTIKILTTVEFFISILCKKRVPIPIYCSIVNQMSGIIFIVLEKHFLTTLLTIIGIQYIHERNTKFRFFCSRYNTCI